MSVQFAPLQSMTTAHVARFWEAVRGRFPRWTEARPIDQVVEYFGAPRVGVPKFAITLEGGVVPHRALFEDAAGTELVQVQRDRFVRNWRRRGAGEAVEYPRYPALRERFREDLERFINFVEGVELGGLDANQCELTYVNHIAPEPTVWERHGEANRVVRILAPPELSGGMPDLENLDATFRYVFPWTGKTEPAGRLYVDIRSVHRTADRVPLIVATLTARGRPHASAVGSVLEWMDVAHLFLVRTFTALTTPTMHRIWERRDVR